jgi:hypothetical protein
MRRVPRRFALFQDARSPNVRNFTYPALGWPSADADRPLDLKGVGEATTAGSLPAVDAIVDALSIYGITDLHAMHVVSRVAGN